MKYRIRFNPHLKIYEAHFPAERRAVGEWLTSDIGCSMLSLKLVRERLKSIQARQLSEFELLGNAFELRATNDGVEFVDRLHYDGRLNEEDRGTLAPLVRLGIAEVVDILDMWQRKVFPEPEESPNDS